MNKYEILENETKVVGGYTLHRIKALKDIFCANGKVVKTGDLGGWIEKKENLSQDGNAWIGGDAKVYDGAWICGNAKVYGNAWIYGNAQVYGNAKVYGAAKVYGNAWIGGDAEVRDGYIGGSGENE